MPHLPQRRPHPTVVFPGLAFPTLGEPYPLTLPFPLVVLPKEGQNGSQEGRRAEGQTSRKAQTPPETVVSKCFPQDAGDDERYTVHLGTRSDSNLEIRIGKSAQAYAMCPL